TYCGTSLAELEVDHEERVDPFIYIKYGPFVIGTVRPETKFRDTALAVNPKDKRYKDYIGKSLEIMGLLGPITMKVIPDPEVDPEFGTGIMKVTPAHDAHDFELGKLHNLPVTPIITLQGKMDFSWFINDPINKNSKYLERAIKYHGLKVAEARKIILEDLKSDGLLEKIDEKYTHNVSLCYKCKRILEPTVIPNWYIKVDSLKKPVIAVVKKDEINFHPHRFKKHMLDWLSIMHDWPISRQNAWGIRIPVWYSTKENPDMSIAFINPQGKYTFGVISELLKTYSFGEIESGLQTLRTGQVAKYIVSKTKPSGDYFQETDTFDTWFSSGHWPIVTGGNLPTAMLGTLADILRFWVSRMIMFSLYLKDKIPFKDVYLWSMVADSKGTKMSKSKGNVVNPIELVDRYGADALRMTLLYGIAPGGSISLSEDKVRGMRNFSNKLWNVARYVQGIEKSNPKINKDDKEILKKIKKVTKEVTSHLDKYQFGLATKKLYAFVRHEFADIYIEKTKDRKADAYPTLSAVLDCSLRLLHPFMPFVTESIWQELGHKDLLISASWPK
ncbi:MAG: class I tRNA ligase family protein, partial [Candidatus Amesbacteria bacterium]|nr:class I tRNA ligase family protein [Candidatus Amesbacteria bacterium]